jgi:hypothetical protein
MNETVWIAWLVVIVVLVAVDALFLIGALSVEKAIPDKEDDCTCKQTRWTVYADIDCPIHGER